MTSMTTERVRDRLFQGTGDGRVGVRGCMPRTICSAQELQLLPHITSWSTDVAYGPVL